MSLTGRLLPFGEKVGQIPRSGLELTPGFPKYPRSQSEFQEILLPLAILRWALTENRFYPFQGKYL